jgi:hypothetical protein
MAGISQLDAARRQIDCAIGLLDTEDLAAHTLAWAAFNLLFEMVGDDATRKVMLGVKKNLKLGKSGPSGEFYMQLLDDFLTNQGSAIDATTSVEVILLGALMKRFPC